MTAIFFHTEANMNIQQYLTLSELQNARGAKGMVGP